MRTVPLDERIPSTAMRSACGAVVEEPPSRLGRAAVPSPPIGAARSPAMAPQAPSHAAMASPKAAVALKRISIVSSVPRSADPPPASATRLVPQGLQQAIETTAIVLDHRGELLPLGEHQADPADDHVVDPVVAA